MFSTAKAIDRLLRDAAASKLEIRQVRAQFAAIVEEQQYRRREAERHLVEATTRLRALLPPQDPVELDWPAQATKQPCSGRASSWRTWTRREKGCPVPGAGKVDGGTQPAWSARAAS
jgi:hypothetical protein